MVFLYAILFIGAMGLSFDERMQKLGSRMYKLEHSMALQMTRQMELMDFMESYRQCEFWETDAGAVAIGAIITGFTLMIAFLLNKCFLRHQENQNKLLLSRIKNIVRSEIRTEVRTNCHIPIVCAPDVPPSYDSVSGAV